MEQIRTMPTDQWVMLSDATVGYRGDRWGQSWTLGNAVNGVRPITAAASSASPTEADLDQIRWQAPTANSTPGAINLLSRVKRSAVVLSQMKANADIAKAIANVPEAEAQVAKTDAKVAELVQGLWQNGATETATMTKTEDATRSWMASKPTWILLIITVLVVAMLLGCAAFTGAKEGSHAAWCAALFAGVAALCAWGTIQLYYNVAAGNDAEHVKQRLVNGLTTECHSRE
jgi:hypothetical protein